MSTTLNTDLSRRAHQLAAIAAENANRFIRREMQAGGLSRQQIVAECGAGMKAIDFLADIRRVLSIRPTASDRRVLKLAKCDF
ncbi:hypothetical protein [Bradyrhizobium sp. 2S1]|uniref:hypothetical protein n=1 Tax=Bradyrhizobium sp. 2S1 TaxID=1404429 RepID=UPI00140BB198|nr:hypothetical protein [Bradyrhizobium sp. 2S1]MCK7669173.1 hypothetical protein [Bradyrhizobium sp. 2S1]